MSTKRPAALASGTDPKKAKPSEEPNSFIDELARSPHLHTGEDSWHRPDVVPFDPATTSITFQWMDIDQYDGEPLASNPKANAPVPGVREGIVPIFRLYGTTKEGHSVVAHVHGFTPYFYASVPPGFDESHLLPMQKNLSEVISNSRSKLLTTQVIPAIQLVSNMQSVYGYHFKRTCNMLKIMVGQPSLISAVRSTLESGSFAVPGLRPFAHTCFEGAIPFPLRFMVDRSIVGCNWLELPGGTYSLRTSFKTPAPKQDVVTKMDPHAQLDRFLEASPSVPPVVSATSQSRSSSSTASKKALPPTTHTQLEVDIVYDSIISHPSEGEFQLVAPFRILSFDIECMGRKGIFPDAEYDPVIQIANVLTPQGGEAIVRNIFTLGTCAAIVGADVRSFETEEELLRDWARFVREADPDLLTGYNVQNFDLPYLLNRMRVLKVDDALCLGKVSGVKATMQSRTFQSAAHGKTEHIDTTINGRVCFDMLQFVRREHKLSSYTLNSVSAHFLGQQKEDVHHSIISTLQNGDENDRRRLAVYCLKDAFLPQRLMDKLMVLINHIEMARVTGVPLDYLLTRGQQIKVVSMILRHCKPRNLLIPNLQRQGPGGEDDAGYEGATVIEPLKGFYDVPIATLDFASLYPSIMMAHNLCYSTLLAPGDERLLKPGEYEKSPDDNNHFVTAATHKGILPQILEELLAARKQAKKDMAAATDPLVMAVQNGRQLALKISANSVYGFTGATVGQLPCLAISSCVTAHGRIMIETTKRCVEDTFTVANGYPADATVVYGDTDSVMVKFGVSTVAEAMKLGTEAAQFISKLFPRPVKLEFEKVYFPYLLMNKKRYAGLYWTKPDRWDRMDTKGIETVRRDNCALVRQVVDSCLKFILIERSVDSAVAYVKQVISDLLQNKVDLSMLVITKALGKSADSEDYKAKQAHVELAERMRQRDPGSAPQVGDRVPFVVIEGAKNAPAYEKSEDPKYVLLHNLPVDTKYYLTNQLSGPLTRIFASILPNVNVLFEGDHTVNVARLTPSKSVGIMAFTMKQQKCLGCKASIDSGNSVQGSPLCKYCQQNEAVIYQTQLNSIQRLEQRFTKLWTQCQTCQGSFHSEVICASNDCPIFYMRMKVQKDLESANENLMKFGYPQW